MTYNLVRNPAVRSTATDWSGTAASGTPTVARTSGTVGSGPAGVADTWLRLTATAATAYMDGRNGGVGVNLVTAGTTYTFSSFMRPTTTASLTAQLFIQWFDNASTLLSTTTGPTIPISSATAWNRVSVTDVAPAGAVRANVISRLNAAFAIGDRLDITGFLLEAATSMNPYYDGNTQNYMWSGAADNSPSWGPVVTVVPNTSFTPPRDEITCSLAPGSVMKTASLARIVNGVATQTLSQPSAGFDTQLVYDYLAPYGAPVSYEFISDFVLPAAVLWDETWANLSSWTSTTGFSVSSGTVTGSGGPMSRTATSGSYRVTIASLVGGSVGGVSFGTQLRVYANTAGFIVAVPIGLGGVAVPVTTPVKATSAATIDFFGTSIVISGTGGTYTINGYSSTDFNNVQISSSTSITVGEIKLAAYSASSHTDSTPATPTTLNSAQAWLIHPANPSLSVPISSSDLSSVAIQDLGAVSRASSTTLHQILGQSLPIATTSGPRYGNTQQVKLKARTAAHEAALNGILADGTPLLFRFPPTYDAGFDEGFYAVGTVQRERIAQRKGSHLRQFTLDLTQVQQPTVIVQNAGWSWAALAAAFPTWQAVAQAYNTWADVLTNNRKPGY